MRIRTALTTLLALLALAAPAAANPHGRLDSSFGNNGKLVLSPELLGPKVQQLFYKPAASGQPPFHTRFRGSQVENEGIPITLLPLRGGSFLLAREDRIFRFGRDGALDPGFGEGGYVTITAPPGEKLAPNGVALDSSGRILVAAEAETEGASPQLLPPAVDPTGQILGPVPVRAAILRLLPDGSRDPSFGTAGLVETSFGFPPPATFSFPPPTTLNGQRYEQPAVRALAISADPSGRPVVTGAFAAEAHGCDEESPSPSFTTTAFAARFSASGSLETLSTDPTVTGSEYGASSTPVSGQRSLFVGWQGTPCPRGQSLGSNNVAVALLNGGSGPANGFSARPLTFAEVPGVAIDDRGRAILSGGVEIAEAEFGGEARRLLPNGAVDRGFGNRGTVKLKPRSEEFRAIAVDSRDRAVFGGGIFTAGGFSLTRLTKKGDVDRGFGRRGIARIRFSAAKGGGHVSSLIAERGGPIVAAGSLYLGDKAETEAIGIARYLP